MLTLHQVSDVLMMRSDFFPYVLYLPAILSRYELRGCYGKNRVIFTREFYNTMALVQVFLPLFRVLYDLTERFHLNPCQFFSRSLVFTALDYFLLFFLVEGVFLSFLTLLYRKVSQGYKKPYWYFHLNSLSVAEHGLAFSPIHSPKVIILRQSPIL